jgi:hypothetical protein
VITKSISAIVALLLASTPSLSQQWLKIDSLFTPSGVAVQNFSAPEFAGLCGDKLCCFFLLMWL